MSSKRYDEFTAGAPAGTDVVLFGDPSTGALEKVTIDTFQSTTGVIRQVKITKSYADFAVAATSKDIALVLMPIGAVVVGIIANVTTAFGAINFNITIGKTGDAEFYKPIQDCAYTGDSGPVWEVVTDDWTATSMIRAFATSLSNLNTATTGSIDFYIFYTILD